MTINPHPDRPPLFNGSTSGPAWWREFSIWFAVTGDVESLPRAKMSMNAFLIGTAKDWLKGEEAKKATTVIELGEAFEKKYPGNETADTIFESLFEDPTEAFQRFLQAGMGDADILSEVEVEGRGFRGDIVKHKMAYFHWWVQQAYYIGSQVPSTEMSETVKGRELYHALPPTLQMFVNVPKGTLVQVTQAVAAVNRSALDHLHGLSTRMSIVEKRQPPRAQNISGTGNPSTPFTYGPVGNNGGQGNQGTPANGTNNWQPPANGAKAIRGSQHLTFPDTPGGHAGYARAMEAFTRQNRSGAAPSPYKHMPLKPGTQPPGPGVCDQCGQRGHIRAGCKSDALLEMEIKYRGINSNMQRQEDRAMQLHSVDEFNPELYYYRGESENSEGRA